MTLKLWEMFGIYGRREYDPDTLTSYELRNGISADREKELAYLVYASWKEDANDVGRSAIAWVTLEEIVTALSDNELNVLDHFEQNNPNKEWTEARAALRELHPCDDEDVQTSSASERKVSGEDAFNISWCGPPPPPPPPPLAHAGRCGVVFCLRPPPAPPRDTRGASVGCTC